MTFRFQKPIHLNWHHSLRAPQSPHGSLETAVWLEGGKGSPAGQAHYSNVHDMFVGGGLGDVRGWRRGQGPWAICLAQSVITQQKATSSVWEGTTGLTCQAPLRTAVILQQATGSWLKLSKLKSSIHLLSLPPSHYSNPSPWSTSSVSQLPPAGPFSPALWPRPSWSQHPSRLDHPAGLGTAALLLPYLPPESRLTQSRHRERSDFIKI